MLSWCDQQSVQNWHTKHIRSSVIFRNKNHEWVNKETCLQVTGQVKQQWIDDTHTPKKLNGWERKRSQFLTSRMRWDHMYALIVCAVISDQINAQAQSVYTLTPKKTAKKREKKKNQKNPFRWSDGRQQLFCAQNALRIHYNFYNLTVAVIFLVIFFFLRVLCCFAMVVCIFHFFFALPVVMLLIQLCFKSVLSHNKCFTHTLTLSHSHWTHFLSFILNNLIHFAGGQMKKEARRKKTQTQDFFSP